jgi:hypothetical protein
MAGTLVSFTFLKGWATNSAPIYGGATNFRAAIKGWATKIADTKYMIFPAHPPLLYDRSLIYTANISIGDIKILLTIKLCA